MPYFYNTPDDISRRCSQAIGVGSIEELFDVVPAELRLKRPLDMPPALSELELTQHMQELAAKNAHIGQKVCFLGGGSYDHFIPAVVDAIASRGEFYTSYTPYQPEASQGNLQAFFEYQTLICQLTGMDVSNASLYDGGSAAAEARADGHERHRPAEEGRRRRERASGVSPDPADLLRQHLGAELVTVAAPSGVVDPADVAAAVDDETACVLVQHPNFFGCLEDVAAIAKIAHDAGALFVAVVRSDQPGPAEAAGRLRGRHRRGRRAIAGHADALRRAVPGHHGLPRGVRPPDAGPDRRPDGRSPRPPLLGADAADPRAAHPPRKGHEQHLHQPGAVRPAGRGLPGRAGPAGPARNGRAVPAQGPLRPAAADRRRRGSSLGVRPAVVQGVRRPRSRRPRRPSCWPRPPTPAISPACRWASGIRELDDCFLVTVTEKRTKAEIDGLAEVLAARRETAAPRPHATLRRRCS